MTTANTALPTEQPAGGWGPVSDHLEAMKRAGQAVVDRERSATGEASARFRRGFLELHFVMRPELGPSNGALFNARDKLVRSLADAVGLAEPSPPPDFPLDDFVRDVRAAAESVRSAGLRVDEAPVTLGALLWSPGEATGWQLTVTDASRTVPETTPYAGSPGGPPMPASATHVPATVHLYAFPLQRCSASQSQVRREQPGTVLGATAAAVFFRLQMPQSHDQDPADVLGTSIALRLFPDASPRVLPDVAQSLAATAARAERGVLQLDSPAPPPDGALPRVPGTFAALWITDAGMNRELTLLPAP